MNKIILLILVAFSLTNCNKNNEPLLIVNNTAPEISLPSPSGTILNLSDLKGKVVVVSFWASWCPYCTKDNPNLLKLYNKYHSEGLEVFSVSLDSKKTEWENGIKDEGLIWSTHVSDLLKWKSPFVDKYHVNGTPYKVLVDKKGNIRVLDFKSNDEVSVEQLLKE